jgi:hypothetical protein
LSPTCTTFATSRFRTSPCRTVADVSIDSKPPSLRSRIPSSEDDLVIDLFDFDDEYGINSICIDLTDMPCTDDVISADDLDPDPALDVPESDFCRTPTCRCCSLGSESPIDKFLFDAEVDSLPAIGHEKHLHQIFNDAGDIHEYAINEIRHNDFDGPRAHLGDGAQATTTHVKEHLFAYRTFDSHSPCQTRLVSADGHRYVPLSYGVLRVPSPTALGYIPIFCFHTPEISSCIVSPLTIARLIPRHRHHGTTLQKYTESGAFTFKVHSNLRTSDAIEIHGILDGGLCYTQPLLLPSEPSSFAPNADSDSPTEMHLAALSTTGRIDTYTADHNNTLEHKLHLHKLSVRADRLL